MNKPPLQIAYITGRSFPGRADLSPVQTAFINRLAKPGRTLAQLNFPYFTGASDSTTFEAVGLFTASLNNSRDYLASRRPVFEKNYQMPVAGLLARAQHTVFLAGSCGLELFNNLNLPAALLKTTSVFAYGPVARKRPVCHHFLVQGDNDRISQIWFRNVDSKVRSGHMNYLVNPELLTLCEHFISSIESNQAMP